MKKWDAMKARVPQVLAWEDLKITVGSEIRRFVDVPANSFTDQSVSVEQMIPISGKNRSRARIAAAEAIVQRAEARRVILDNVMKARSAYFRLASDYAQLELNRKNYDSLRQIAEISTARYEVGNQSAAEVLTAQTEASRFLETRRDLERSIAEEETQLNVLMNRDAFTAIGIPESAPIIASNKLSLDVLRRQLLRSRPEIQLAQARVAAEKAKVELARREWIPDPAINLTGQRYNEAAQGISELGAGVSFNVPWLNHRKYSAGTREALDNLAAAESELASVTQQSIGSLRAGWQKVETSHHHVELFHQQVSVQARQAFEASQLGYETGKVTFAEWIGAQRSLREIESMERQHRADYEVALAELEATVGGGGLVSPKFTSDEKR